MRCSEFAVLGNCYQRNFVKEDVVRKLGTSGSQTQITVNTINGGQVHSSKGANDLEVQSTNECVKEWVKLSKSYKSMDLPAHPREIAIKRS